MADLKSDNGRGTWERRRKTEEPENRDAIFKCKYPLIYVNNCFQIYLTLPNLAKPNLTKLKNNKN